MTTHVQTVRRLARSVADRTTSDFAFGMFRLLLAAVGVKISGSWLYVPGRGTPLKGFRAAAEWIAALPESSVFLGDLVEAYARMERDVLGPPAEVPLGRTPVSAAGMTPLSATADDLAEVSKRVEQIAVQLAAATPPAADPHRVVIGDECDILALRAGQEELAGRIARRAAYDTGRAMLDILAGWIEERQPDGSDIFHADDVRRMVNDACRVMGAPEAYRAAS